jgi:hypothetical protein
VLIRGNNITVTGGRVIGVQSPLLKWHDYKRALDGDMARLEGTGITVRGIYLDRGEDGFSTIGGKAVIDQVFADHIRDDIIEDDHGRSFSITNSFVRGQTFLSMRGTFQESAPVVNIRNVLVELILQPHAGGTSPTDINTRGGYPFKDGLGSGYFFKLDGNGREHFNISDSMFLTSRPGSSGQSNLNWPKNVTIGPNVTVIWMGAGHYPGASTLPAGVRLIEGNRASFDGAVAKFFAAHPQFADVRPGGVPIALPLPVAATPVDPLVDPPVVLVGRDVLEARYVAKVTAPIVQAYARAGLAKSYADSMVARFASIAAGLPESVLRAIMG